MEREPIAVVGRGCVLPGALDPAQAWSLIERAASALRPAPPGHWGLDTNTVVSHPPHTADQVPHDRGGYVTGFADVFSPAGFAVPPAELDGLDTPLLWLLHSARQALGEAGAPGADRRGGLILGNLSCPTAGMGQWAEQHWRQQAGGALKPRPGTGADPRNRFSSALPAHLAARALGLDAGGLALDAACASSLYAIKLACDQLHDRRADLMLAGGLSGADGLFLHLGFHALSALSPTGRSLPFHRAADGLLPGEGAAVVALMRLTDAERSEIPVLGVIRGIGLSNDGADGGPLAPSGQGQERAMRAAYQVAELAPQEVSLLECHATGTPVGDETELHSSARVFAGAQDLVVGSAKANFGHLMTAAGAAGLLKVLSAMEHGLRPALPEADAPLSALAGTPFRLPTEAEPWEGPRRAAVSAFGFGGNNAHLIVESHEQWHRSQSRGRHLQPGPPRSAARRNGPRIAVVAVAVHAGGEGTTDDFLDALMTGTARHTPRTQAVVDLDGLRITPNDLHCAHGQQPLLLAAVQEAVHGLTLPVERTMALVGAGCDPDGARYGARWRSHQWHDGSDLAYARALRDACVGPLTAAAVLGRLSNMAANRLNSQFGWTGPSYTVHAEEASGTEALRIGARALAAGEADAVVAAAVDLSHNPVHSDALAAMGHAATPGDAAVVLVLKREADATRDGDRILAVLDDSPESDAAEPVLVLDSDGGLVSDLFGTAHAAHGLLCTAAAVLALYHRAVPGLGRPATPLTGDGVAEVRVHPLGGIPHHLRLRAAHCAGWTRRPAPSLHTYSGADRAEVGQAVRQGRQSDTGPARLVLLCERPEELITRAQQAASWLADGAVTPAPADTFYADAPLGGEVAFVFTNGSAAQQPMHPAPFLALPAAVDHLRHLYGSRLRSTTAWMFTEPSGESDVLTQMSATACLAHLHTHLTRKVLSLHPSAVIGYSSGEATSMLAMGVWPNRRAFLTAVEDSGLFRTALTGPLTAVRAAWAHQGITGDSWSSHLVLVSRAQVESALAAENAAHLLSVNAPGVCVIGGESGACGRVLARLPGAVHTPLDYDLAAHAPELHGVRDLWRTAHTHPVAAPTGVRFYSGATTHAYWPTTQTVADSVTEQAMGTLDFPRTVERAWQDGVRVFIEHGPAALCTGWIRRTLEGHPHLAVALDDGGDPRQFWSAAAQLVAAGVSVDHERLARATAPSVAAHHPVLPLRVDVRASPVELPQPPAPHPRGPHRARPALPAPRHIPVPDQVPAPRPPSRPYADTRDTLTATHQCHVTGYAAAHRQFLHTMHSLRNLALPLDTPAQRPGRAAAPAPLRPPDSLPRGLRTPTGPSFSRADLERLAAGRISDLFGPRFAPQDAYAVQTRMPRPPMLLADRVLGLDADPGVLAAGTVWTATDVRTDSWYLDPAGRMPAGLMIEAGQADLLLISWMGADLLNQGERVYRLLGCTTTFHGPLPTPGETLTFQIVIDGHGEHDGVRLFFFHYDCWSGTALKLSVRDGQAGFFTPAELAATGGILQAPTAVTSSTLPFTPPPNPSTACAFTAAEVHAFRAGRPAECFGADWDDTRCHVRTPRIGDGRQALFERVDAFDPAGGPHGRGYLRAATPIRPDDWFFAGHFLNDPCMPGTLMLEGCLQAMAFHLAACGLTRGLDGARFEPVPGSAIPMKCRGQVTPDSRELLYEVFVTGLGDERYPTLTADIMCTVDGVKAFHAEGLALRLVADWPLAHWRQLGPARVQETGTPVALADLAGLIGHHEQRPAAQVDGHTFDHTSLLSSAWGMPSDAFGSFYRVFDGDRRSPRLPGPPYLFISRIRSVRGPMGGMETGSEVVAEYDLPERVWFREQNPGGGVPLAALMEMSLQPCGWLASYAGSALTGDQDLLFRNLGGTATLHRPIGAGPRIVTTRATLTDLNQDGASVIASFDIETSDAEGPLAELHSSFGFFPPEAFAEQTGLGATAAGDGPDVPFPAQPAPPERGEAACGQLAEPMLRMIDRITGYLPHGGSAGLGRIRGEKAVSPDDWFFKSHFFHDPVQPGSLGVEAMNQLVRHHLLQQHPTTRPSFDTPPTPLQPFTWTYRGQVTPATRLITVEADITARTADEHGMHAVADARLWADGLCIYRTTGLAVRLHTPPHRTPGA
ncbi:beta-ketoacyl synthase N-terminal-like domain-containing protein [Streptomyces sp. NPDC002564]|uniref:beta-ketoacyl synthase N-terminal-like domain-containing protein n=1 Tax=Streptomyces sp. NPDC002564 TaxID=3364649 RepID=UPI0036A9935B